MCNSQHPLQADCPSQQGSTQSHSHIAALMLSSQLGSRSPQRTEWHMARLDQYQTNTCQHRTTTAQQHAEIKTKYIQQQQRTRKTTSAARTDTPETQYDPAAHDAVSNRVLGVPPILYEPFGTTCGDDEPSGQNTLGSPHACLYTTDEQDQLWDTASETMQITNLTLAAV